MITYACVFCRDSGWFPRCSDTVCGACSRPDSEPAPPANVKEKLV